MLQNVEVGSTVFTIGFQMPAQERVRTQANASVRILMVIKQKKPRWRTPVACEKQQ